jgi:hypothetical protein
MAKKSEYHFSKKSRAEQIALCGECNGNPPVEPFTLQNMTGTYCSKCMIVVDWQKIGESTKVTKKKVVQLSGEYPKKGDIMEARVIKVEEEEIKLGEINFDDLKFN